MRYIETFREKETITGIYYCSQKSTALSKTGKEYKGYIMAIDKIIELNKR